MIPAGFHCSRFEIGSLAEHDRCCYNPRVAIFLVRHGETAGNVERVLQRADVPLNELGLRQAEQVAARLASVSVERVVVSDLLRARMTAAAICARVGVEAFETPLLAERSFGDLRGTPYDRLPGDPFAPDFVPLNGETWSVFHTRVDDAFALVTQLAGGLRENLVVVTHGLVCRAFAQRHLQLGVGQVLPARFANTGVTVFEPEPPYAVRLLDCTAHLGSDNRSAGDGGAA
jgi:probable phosphoglycerate mutase